MEPSASCPRCGYDLSGQIVQWKLVRPLETRCAECGLEDVLRLIENPLYRIPDWSFEHAAFHRLRSLRRTMVRSLRPLRFWEEMPIEAPIRIRRLGQYVAASIFLAAIVFPIVIALEVGASYLLTPVPSPSVNARGFVVGVPRVRLTSLTSLWNALHPSLVRSMFWTLLFPLTLLCLPQTFRRYRVRKLQILRVAAYSVWPPVFLYGLVLWAAASTSVNQGALFLRFEVGRPWVITIPVLTWLWFYWYRALGTYLRLPTPGLIVALNMLLAFLAATALVVGIGEATYYAWIIDW